MLSKGTIEVLQRASQGKIPCKGINPQAIDKLRREGFVKITVDRRGEVPHRFAKITPEGERYLEDLAP